MNPKLKKKLLLLLKIGISLSLFYFVYQKIDFKSVLHVVAGSNITYMLIAVIFFVTSQVVSSFRLNYLFHGEAMPLSHQSNLKLYLLGMFYNFFVPGGVGGDAYKVYLLQKEFSWSSKKILKIVFIDRLIGLVAIVTLLLTIGVIYPLLIKLIIGDHYSVILLVLLPVFILCSQFGVKFLFKIIGKIFYVTLAYSLVIQLLQVISVFFIMLSLGIDTNMYYLYIFVFLLSSIFSIISFAGIGVREFLFFQMSQQFSLNENTAVTIGTLFTLITAAISVFGLAYHIKKPKLTKTSEL